MGLAQRTPTEEKPGAILAAALELFAERGFHATNVPLIAQRAGVAVGTLYHHFPSKEAMANELYRRLRREMERAVYRDVPLGLAPHEWLRQVWQRTVAFARNRPPAFLFLVAHHHGAYLDPASRALDDELRAGAHDRLEWWRRAGVVAPLPDEVLAAFTDGAIHHLARAGSALTPEVVDQAAAACWRAIAEGGPPVEQVTFAGETGRLSLSVEPGAHGPGGGERRGTVAVASWNFQALGKVWFAVAEAIRFHADLAACQQALAGAAAFRTSDGNLSLEVAYEPRGQVKVRGVFHEAHRDGNVLHFTIPTDQSYIGQALEELGRLARGVT